MKANRKFAFNSVVGCKALKTASSCSVLAIAMLSGVSAYAQEAPAEEVEAADIIVTGSRIASPFEQPTPVAIKTAEDLQTAQPISLTLGLLQSPQFSNSSGPRSNALSSPTDIQGNYLNLRGLGSGRTLILVDGDRVPPTSFDGRVDVDVIPEMLVSRVDVVTAGVSAVYGSDAVSGVVNYIINDEFEGVELRGQSGISTYGDALGYKFGGALGSSFASGRGHVVFSVEHKNDDEILQQDRPETGRRFGFGGRGATSDANIAGSAAFPLELREGVNWRSLTPYPFVASAFPFNSRLAGTTVDANGNIIPNDPGTYVSSTTQIGGSGGVVDPTRTLISGSTATRAYGKVKFDLTDNVTVFAQGQYSRSRTPFHTAINFGAFIPMQGNPFLPAGALPSFFPAGTPAAVYVVFPSLNDFGGPRTTETNESWSIKAGLEGNLGGSWNFRAVYQHGEVDQNTVSREVNQQHLFAAVDVVSVNGVPTCYIKTVNPTALPGCVPYNPFGANRNGSNVPALQQFLFGDSIYDTTSKLDVFSANVTGEPFSLPAGPVGVSLGVEYRKNSLVRTSNSDPATPFSDFGGAIRFPTSSTRFNVSNIGVIDGGNNVKEANIEVLVPITQDTSPIGALAVSGAGRWTDYSTSGTVYTWKAGATWEPIDQIRFRGTLSRDIRAPNLFELFAGATSGLLNYIPPAPFLQVGDTRPTLGGGNRNLVPEVANTLSFGVVLEPVSGFNISVDYYDIDLKGAIQSRSINDILTECGSSGFASPACANITLESGANPTPALLGSPALMDIATVFAGPENLAFLSTKGIDIDARYSLPLGSGKLTLRANANVLLSYKSQSNPLAPIVSQAGYIDGADTLVLQNAIQPKLRGTMSAGYEFDGGTSVFLQGRYIGNLKLGEVPGLTVGSQTNAYVDEKIGAVMYFDANVKHTIASGPFGGTLDLFANVNNIFNKRPPAFPSKTNPTNLFPTYAPLYDIMGRFFTVGAKFKF